jgi:hypothetical protein
MSFERLEGGQGKAKDSAEGRKSDEDEKIDQLRPDSNQREREDSRRIRRLRTLRHE